MVTFFDMQLPLRTSFFVIILLIWVVLIVIYVRPFLKEYWTNVSDYLNHDDELLIRIIKNKHLHPPSQDEYSLIENHLDEDGVYYKYKRFENPPIFLLQVLRMIFEKEPPGFFLDVGALDGEFLSHSLFLEMDHNWNGLLVEPNKFSFKKLLKKNRKVWSTNLCAGLRNYSYKGVLEYPNDFEGKPYSHSLRRGVLVDKVSYNKELVSTDSFSSIDCVPLISLIRACQVTKVDLLFLDINGFENEVLDTFPLGSFPVDVWVVKHLNKKPLYPKVTFDFDLIQRFINSGYVFFAVEFFEMSYVMVNASSLLLQKALQKRPPSWASIVAPFSPSFSIHDIPGF